MRTIVLSLLALSIATAAHAQSKASDSTKRPIEAVLSHPLFTGIYSCSEHSAGQLPSLGDDLGQDCVPYVLDRHGGPGFPTAYKSDGAHNEDWHGWNQPVHAPADGKILKIGINPSVNQPGKTGRPPASFILLKTNDDVFFVLAHIQSPTVKEGDEVRAGDQLASVGNNGFGRLPHVHIGAWKGQDALQIRWDQQKMTDPK